MKPVLLMLQIFYFVFSVTPIYGQQTYRINLEISADEKIQSKVESFVARELRSLGDVAQTSEYADYQISVVALILHTLSGQETGIAISVCINQSFYNGFLSHLFKDDVRSLGMQSTEGTVYFVSHWLRSGGTDDLQSICTGIVADFDSQFLQPRRKQDQKMNDMKNK
jgi:hypothetical protein